jgi:hypothetical protein
MGEPSIGDLIKAGEFQRACVRADAEFEESGNIFPLRNKVIALLQLDKLDETILLSEKIIRLNAGSTDSDFIFLGVARWLKRQPVLAIEVWKTGLKSKYTDAAGGVEIPMLLLFASVRMLDKKLEKEATNLLKKACRTKRTMNWPGPLAQYLLDLISEAEMRSRIDAQPILYEKQSCQADFYAGLKRHTSGDEVGFQERLESCIGHGIVCSFKAETYLAKGELNVLRSN